MESEIRQLQVIGGEIAVRQIAGTVRLIIEAFVGLRVVADISAVSIIDGPIETAIVAGFIERTRDDGGGCAASPAC